MDYGILLIGQNVCNMHSCIQNKHLVKQYSNNRSFDLKNQNQVVIPVGPKVCLD